MILNMNSVGTILQIGINKNNSDKLLFPCRIIIVFIILNCVFFQGDNLFWKEDGDMLTPKMRPNLKKNKRIWKPKKCSMHFFDSREFKECWRSHKENAEFTSLYFVGDSHEKNLFTRFLTQFYTDLSCDNTKPEVYTNNVCQNRVNRLSIVYHFMPTIDDNIKGLFLSWEEKSFVPDFLMMGCTLHPILNSNASDSYRHEFRRNLTNFLPFLDRLARKTPVLWYLQPPVDEEKMLENHRAMDNKNVIFYNKIVTEEIPRTRVILWTSAREIAIDGPYKDGVHVGESSSNYYMQILSNFWCNHRISYNGTCSKGRTNLNSYRTDYGIYFIVAQGLLVLVVAILKKCFGGHIWSNSSVATDMTLHQEKGPINLNLTSDERFSYLKMVLVTVKMLSKVSFCLGYVYICESIPIFLKDRLSFSQPFMAASLVVTVFLVLYTCQKLDEDYGVLKRQLIDETKGLLIVALLFLKLNSFSSHLIIIPVHLTESAFISLIGVEIFQHCWANKPMNLCNFLKELCSQNILAVLLCLVLQHPFIQYEIFPVVMVCFTVTYVILALPPRPLVVTLEDEGVPNNAWTAILVLFFKVVTLVAVFGLVLNSLIILDERIFSHSLWRGIFATKEDTFDPWLRRWNSDKFCFIYGVIIGFALQVCHLLGTITILKCPKLKLCLITMGLIPAMSIFFLYRVYASIESATSLQHIGYGYTVVFGYLTIGFILLRSTLVQICSHYSKLLATLGRFWREIYLLHFHIWMAYDGNAFLVLLTFSTFINLCCITFILIFVCYDMHQTLEIIFNQKTN